MKFYCYWMCKKIGAVFMVDSVEVFERCPFHLDEEPEVDEDGERYPNHFEDGHVKRLWEADLLPSWRKP